MSQTTERGKAWIATSTGLVLEGRSCGAAGTASGELCFNTSMTGYQEIMTHPGAAGQVLVFTMPEIGVYGVNANDETTPGVKATAVIARAITEKPSNWASEGSLPEYLEAHNVVAIDRVDTRLLTKHIRDHGSVTAIVTTEEAPADDLIAKAKAVEATEAMTEAEAKAKELGAVVARLPIGHHASNIPVKNIQTGELHITSQHHNYDFDFDGVEGVEVTYLNMNDATVEGFRVIATGEEFTFFAPLELRPLNPATLGSE